MANLRIIASNAACRASLSASSTAGLLGVTNLVGDKKSDVWRATGTTARISGTLTAPELASGVALLGNFSPTDTIRVRLTNELPATNLLTNTSSGSAMTSNGDAGTVVNAGLAPDGTTTTIRISSGSRYRAASNMVVGTVYTYSEFVKSAGGTGATLLKDGGGTSVTAVFAFATGAISGAGSTAVAIGGGWYRVSMTFTATATTGSFHYLPSGGAVEFWGAQLEAGAAPTSYYPSGSTPGARPAGFIDNWQSYDCDTGVILACPAPAIQLEGWTAAQSASAYAYGGGAYARAWFPETQFRAFAIDLVDTNNLQGYIEASKLVIGRYWSPPYGLTSVSATDVDATTHYSTAAGDLLSRASTISKEVSIEMRALVPADRARLANILRASRAYPIFVSVRTGDPDLEVERAHTVLGKRMGDSEVALQAAERYGSKITVRSI